MYTKPEQQQQKIHGVVHLHWQVLDKEEEQHIIMEPEAGGGWYGGGASSPDTGAPGGSGYALSLGSDQVKGYQVGYKYFLTSTSVVAGNTSFSAPGGGNETGHSGNGCAKITTISYIDCKSHLVGYFGKNYFCLQKFNHCL